LHPTRLCNLACLHCYSESDPHQRASLEPDEVGRALGHLRAEGYALVSLSGGEPSVYPELRAIVLHARSLGFRVTMISNGFLPAARMENVLLLLDGVAISFDGLADTHNAMRGRPDAFERSCATLRQIAEQGRPVAAAISLTREAIAELPDLADHLVGLGASALQIRPVARAGRARSLDPVSFYTPIDQARLYLVVQALQQELPGIRIHCDLVPAQGLWQQRDAYAGLLGSCEAVPYEDRPLADLVNPLVITDSGALKPIAYDFDTRFDVASVRDPSPERLRMYKRERVQDLQTLIGGALSEMRDSTGFVDWFDHCARLSEGPGQMAPRVRSA
jgi:pyruvate-formate lyase-activating enzyme